MLVAQPPSLQTLEDLKQKATKNTNKQQNNIYQTKSQHSKIPFSTQVKIIGLCTDIPVYRLAFSIPNPTIGYLLINSNPLLIISNLSRDDSEALGSIIVKYLSTGFS